MLQLSQVLFNRAILSLRTGGEVGIAIRPIINPTNLKIEGWYASDRFTKGQLVLPSIEVREILAQGLVVNDHEAMTHPDELVRLHDVLKLNFNLIDKPVETAGKRKLGKISDFAVDLASLYIQKLYVNQSLLRNINGGELIIDRQQIVEITDKKIVVRDVEERAGWPATVPAS